MKLQNKVAVVTGGSSGIGRALCRRFAAEGARGVVVADLDAAGAAQVASETGGLAVTVDVGREADIVQLVERAMAAYGTIDLFCSNAGIALEGGIETRDSDWRRIWGINLMAHVYAARAVLPAMLARGEGYLLQTASAAGLLTQIGSAPYAVTKHAAVAFAEWLAVTYAHRGLTVQAICPLGVRTPMLDGADPRTEALLGEGAIQPEAVADAVMQGIADGRFLILPHPEVAGMYAGRAAETDRWLRGMSKVQQRLEELG